LNRTVKSKLLLLRALFAAAEQSMGRFTLWMACHGISLPWGEWAQTVVSTQTLERYRRRALVAQLKVQRYRIGRGPFFLRGALDALYSFIRWLQFPTLLSAKFMAAFFVCTLPLLVFFAVRVYLPVPQRITKMQSALNMRAVFSAEAVVPSVLKLAENPNTSALQTTGTAHSPTDLFFDFRTLDPHSAEGVLLQGQGSAHEEMRRGWKLSAEADLLFKFPLQTSQRVLRLRYRPIPSELAEVECKLQVMSDVGQIIFATSFDTKTAGKNRLLKSPLTRHLQERLMPEFAMRQSDLVSSPLALTLPAGETFLRFRVERLAGSGDANACAVLLHGFEWSFPQADSRPMLTNKRPTLLMLFNSLNADVASDVKVMPWLSEFLRRPGTFQFTQHHTLDTRERESFKTLIGLQNSILGSANQKENQLIERLRAQGYRVVLLGHLDAQELLQSVTPDVTIRVSNETYEPRLVLSQLMKVIEEESSAPIFLIVRLNGMHAPWRPTISEFAFKDLLFGGIQRGLMDAVLFSHLRTLDRELEWHFGELFRSEIFSKMDFIVTAERGFDLGLNLSRSDVSKPTFKEDLLINEESLRVPLGIAFANSSGNGRGESLIATSVVSSHIDLARSLWENFGISDVKFPVESRRLWQKSTVVSLRPTTASFSLSDSDVSTRSLPVRSLLQEGVLFTDSDSAGGFLKYTSQPLPARIRVTDAYGWPVQHSLLLPAGEQFRQVSKRGQREDVIGRVNSRFVRESRRVIRQGRRFPLRLRFKFHDETPVDLTFAETATADSKFTASLPAELKLMSKRSDAATLIHRIVGTAKAEQIVDLKGGVNSFRFTESQGKAVLVACPEAYAFTPQAITNAIGQKSVCLLEPPEHERVQRLRENGRKIVSLWLVEDENQICKEQVEDEREEGEFADCNEASPSGLGR